MAQSFCRLDGLTHFYTAEDEWMSFCSFWCQLLMFPKPLFGNAHDLKIRSQAVLHAT